MVQLLVSFNRSKGHQSNFTSGLLSAPGTKNTALKKFKN
jgi:hypothetical protein